RTYSVCHVERQPHRGVVADAGDCCIDTGHQPPASKRQTPVSVIAVVGLATMGMNLARNLARNGFGVSVYNRTTSRVDDFMKQYGTEGACSAATAMRISKWSPC